MRYPPPSLNISALGYAASPESAFNLLFSPPLLHGHHLVDVFPRQEGEHLSWVERVPLVLLQGLWRRLQGSLDEARVHVGLEEEEEEEKNH